MFEIINPLDTKDYDDHVAAHPAATFFHTSAWARVLAESYGYAPKYFTIGDHTGFSAIVPIMEIDSILTGRRGVSLPFSDYCEPILPVSQTLQTFMESAMNCGKLQRWKYFEMRCRGELPEGLTASQKFLCHRIDLTRNENDILFSFRDSTRSSIRKATRAGVTVAFGKDAEFMNHYYRLHAITRKEHGLPPQPVAFFRKVLQHVISKGSGQIGLASRGHNVIAGAVCCTFKRQVLFKYLASDKIYQESRPNNMLYWETIRRYASQGYESLCLGRTEKENSGLLQFKRGWGTQESVISYCKYNLRRQSFVTGNLGTEGFHTRVFRTMPIPLLRMMGTLMYRHAG